MLGRICVYFVILLLFCNTVKGMAGVESRARGDAVRLNNIGTALMNQRLLEKAIDKFDEAYRLDPSLTAAELNKGIALLYLQRLPEATTALQHAAAQAPNDPHIWYVFGLLYRIDNKPQQSAEAFQRVLKLDPSSSDSHYFLGSLLANQQNFPAAAAEFRAALRLAPLHASAEFGLARTLQRQGKVDDARVALARFQQLTNANLSFPFSHTYGEEGALGRAEDAATNAPKVGPMIPVKFSRAWESVSDEPRGSGTDGPHTNGACLIDMDGDGRASLVLMGSGASAVQMFRNTGTGGFKLATPAQSGLEVSGDGIACAVGDFDNDGLADIAIAMSDRVLLFRNVGGKFTDVTQAAKIVPMNHPSSLIFVDYDHDGDLDLFVTGEGDAGAKPNVLWRNNGDKTFTDWTQQAGLGGEGRTTASVLTDLNNDRAVDLVVTGSGSAPTFFANPRDGAFQPVALFSEKGLPPTTGIVTFDFNKDGWMDIALIHAGAPGMTLWKSIAGKRFERVALPLQNANRGWSVAAVDFDNDGWLDLAMVLETASESKLKMLRNLGPDGFVDVTEQLKLEEAKVTSPRSLLAMDLNGDGAADLVVTQANGAAVALMNKGGERNHALKISLKGLADNKSALGTKVEVFANGLWQKWEVTSTQDIIAGLGGADEADLLRLLWPTGVPQDEIDIPAGKRLKLTELDRRGSSCPTLFAWDGSKFAFVSDVIGAAVVGHWTSPVERNTADPDEWIKIDGTRLKAHQGSLSLRFGEPMEEVNFVDQVRLVAVDHPEGTDVYPNERFLSETPFVKAKTILTQTAHAPAGAWDNHGNDVLPLLRNVDHRYVEDFTNLPYAGFTNSHALTLDLGTWMPGKPLLLLLHGFIEYFTANSMYAAWQAGIAPVAPFVEAQLPDGSWRRIIEDMGFPAGLPRTIVVDLTGKVPTGSRRVRIATNLQIYWDQVLMDNEAKSAGTSTDAKIQQTELPLMKASLAFRGYPQQIEGVTPGDLNYDYKQMSRTGPFIPQRGAYTHYGDVTPLLQGIDDEYVIFGTGEDMDLEFSAAAQPVLPAHWVRDYFFYANGFVKDMDFYEASPFTVDAMPFHAMSAYPYQSKEHYPDDAEHVAYQLNWNDRFESGDAAHRYEFHYLPTRSAPGAKETRTPR
ncbi:MAG: repeat protein [Edaphobacter sp.]|nr:repeat protein [Edaphobacter sp.]